MENINDQRSLDQISLNQSVIKSSSYIHNNQNIEKVNFFQQNTLREIEPNSYILEKDPYTPYTIILRKTISIINSTNFELIKEIRNIPEKINLNNINKIVLFTQNKIIYMLIYDDKLFAIYNLSIKDYNNYVIFHMSELQENERIINIKPLNNDVNFFLN